MEKIKKTNFLGLPEEVKFCKKCVMTNQRPSSVIEFKNNQESNSVDIPDAFNLSSLNTSENQRIVSDVVNSLGATDGSLLAMATPTDT